MSGLGVARRAGSCRSSGRVTVIVTAQAHATSRQVPCSVFEAALIGNDGDRSARALAGGAFAAAITAQSRPRRRRWLGRAPPGAGDAPVVASILWRPRRVVAEGRRANGSERAGAIPTRSNNEGSSAMRSRPRMIASFSPEVRDRAASLTRRDSVRFRARGQDRAIDVPGRVCASARRAGLIHLAAAGDPVPHGLQKALGAAQQGAAPASWFRKHPSPTGSAAEPSTRSSGVAPLPRTIASPRRLPPTRLRSAGERSSLTPRGGDAVAERAKWRSRNLWSRSDPRRAIRCGSFFGGSRPV
jgi:hypothetical protein